MKTIFKKVYLLIAGVSFLTIANATIHTVTVQNHIFTPSSFTALVGDTVLWTWINGTHTTTSQTIPAGATSWNSNINTTSTSFQYIITNAGTYNYWCNFHHTMGMIGSFTVSATGVPVIENNTSSFAKVYPNPTTRVINVQLYTNPGKNEFIVSDITGKVILKEALTQKDNAIDISNWAKGTYLFRLENEGELMEGKFEVQ